MLMTNSSFRHTFIMGQHPNITIYNVPRAVAAAQLGGCGGDSIGTRADGDL